jgi:cytochrome c553
MRTVALLFVSAAAVAVAASGPPFRPVATISQIMVAITLPYSDALLYIERNPPKGDRDWETLQMQALMLAESGNLLMMDGRAKNQGQWMKDARLLVEAGAAAVTATRAKDLQAVLALNNQIVAACITCHTQFRPRRGRGKND